MHSRDLTIALVLCVCIIQIIILSGYYINISWFPGRSMLGPRKATYSFPQITYLLLTLTCLVEGSLSRRNLNSYFLSFPLGFEPWASWVAPSYFKSFYGYSLSVKTWIQPAAWITDIMVQYSDLELNNESIWILELTP